MRVLLAILAVALTVASTAQANSVLHVPGVSYPIVCYATQTTLATASRGEYVFAARIAGTWDGTKIALAPKICSGLSYLMDGWSGTDEWVSVFVLAHELSHASGTDAVYESAHQSDPVFLGDAQHVAASYSLPFAAAEREVAADCVAVGTAPGIAYRLGMRGRTVFAGLAAVLHASGYMPSARSCFAS